MDFKTEALLNELFGAVHRNDFEKVKQCIAEKVDLNYSDNLAGNTALMNAVQENHFHIVKLLLIHGADTEHKNYDGYTALSLAKLYQKEDGVSIVNLLEMHVNPLLRK